MEDKALYRPILRKAWEITKRFKTLWFFGLFAAILSSGGEFELLSRILFSSNTKTGAISGMIEGFKEGAQGAVQAGESIWVNIWTTFTTNPSALLSIILIGLITLAIIFFVIWLAVVSQVGIIRNINLISKNKKTTINEAIDEGVNNFWPILGVNAVYKLILMIILGLLGREIFLLAFMGTTGNILLVISLVIVASLIIIVSFIVRYQILYMILRKEKAIPALKSAWSLFKGHWLISLEMAFILFLVYFVGAYIAAFATSVFLAVPLVFLTYANQIPVSIIMSIGLMAVITAMVLSFLITAILSTFQWSSWVLLFNQISSKGAISRIVHLSEKSPNITNPFKK